MKGYLNMYNIIKHAVNSINLITVSIFIAVLIYCQLFIAGMQAVARIAGME